MTVDNLREALGYTQGDKEVTFEGKVVVGVVEKGRTVELIYRPIVPVVELLGPDDGSQVE